jgi:hypothetical protein
LSIGTAARHTGFDRSEDHAGHRLMSKWRVIEHEKWSRLLTLLWHLPSSNNNEEEEEKEDAG